MEIIPLLKQLGFSDKEANIYLTLLELGPVSVRNLAEKSRLNRGTAYDILKKLKESGLVSYYHKATKQYFIAEDPNKLKFFLEQKLLDLESLKDKVELAIPRLQSVYNKAGGKPVVKYYEGPLGIKTILSDVIQTTANLPIKEYLVFSSSTIKNYLYQALPNFTKLRIRKQIRVKVIAVGHEGTSAALAEIKSLTKNDGSPTYIIIYDNKVALISINDQRELLGILLEDQALSATQKQLFEYIWNSIN